MEQDVLKVKRLKTYFFVDKKELPAVDGVSFNVKKGETVALIGESGSGKSVTSLSIMGLIQYPGKIIEGDIIFNGENLLEKKESEMRKIRGNKISMVYQEPMASLNPMMKIGDQIAEALIIHQKMKKKEARAKTIELMERVGISDAQFRYDEYPSQFSGGMRQRIIIAMAIACNPELLIADEPTTALDVTIQAEILDLLKKLKVEYNMSMILVTHDLGVVAEMADTVCVMYCGKIMEKASKEILFKDPMNPYTIGLMKCIPGFNSFKDQLYTIDGYVPHPSDFPQGCRFSNRCDRVMEKCEKELPELSEIKEGHFVRCHLYEDALEGSKNEHE